MRIIVENVLRTHSYMRTEAPPRCWQPDADDETFFRLLGELIVFGLGRGNELDELTLSFANVMIDDSAADSLPVGEHVAMAVAGAGDWKPEAIWCRGEWVDPPSALATPDLQGALVASDAVAAYARQTGPQEGSITILRSGKRDCPLEVSGCAAACTRSPRPSTLRVSSSSAPLVERLVLRSEKPGLRGARGSWSRPARQVQGRSDEAEFVSRGLSPQPGGKGIERASELPFAFPDEKPVPPTPQLRGQGDDRARTARRLHHLSRRLRLGGGLARLVGFAGA